MVFCTSYFENQEYYYLRYKKWISYYTNLPGFSEDKDLFMLDDGSDLIVADNLYNYIEDEITEETNIEKMNFFHFSERWGNISTANHPGWYRSFLFSLDIAETLGYEKIIHIESDLYILSDSICNYINNTNSGWVSFLCPKYNFPESSIQIINKDAFSKLRTFRDELLAKGLKKLAHANVEHMLPLTHLEKSFKGDRYGETNEPQCESMDYYAQSRLDSNFRFIEKEKQND